jgi:hypothetical protein
MLELAELSVLAITTKMPMITHFLARPAHAVLQRFGGCWIAWW